MHLSKQLNIIFTELLSLLNESEEPLPKRLKIADNAFKCTELPIPGHEVFLLKWLTKLESNELNVWELFYSWISSIQITNISKNDITEDDTLFITDVSF